MKNIYVLVWFSLTSTFVLGGDFDYSKMSRVDTLRLDKMVARNMSSLDEPCLYIEILDPENNWAPVLKKNICSYEGRSFYSDFTYAGFTDVNFVEGGLEANLTLIPLRAAIEDNLYCRISIGDGEIGQLSCSQGRENYY